MELVLLILGSVIVFVGAISMNVNIYKEEAVHRRNKLNRF